MFPNTVTFKDTALHELRLNLVTWTQCRMDIVNAYWLCPVKEFFFYDKRYAFLSKNLIIFLLLIQRHYEICTPPSAFSHQKSDGLGAPAVPAGILWSLPMPFRSLRTWETPYYKFVIYSQLVTACNNSAYYVPFVKGSTTQKTMDLPLEVDQDHSLQVRTGIECRVNRQENANPTF